MENTNEDKGEHEKDSKLDTNQHNKVSENKEDTNTNPSLEEKEIGIEKKTKDLILDEVSNIRQDDDQNEDRSRKETQNDHAQILNNGESSKLKTDHVKNEIENNIKQEEDQQKEVKIDEPVSKMDQEPPFNDAPIEKIEDAKIEDKSLKKDEELSVSNGTNEIKKEGDNLHKDLNTIAKLQSSEDVRSREVSKIQDETNGVTLNRSSTVQIEENEEGEGKKDDKKKSKTSKEAKLLKALEEKYKLIFKENNQRREDTLELISILKRICSIAEIPLILETEYTLGEIESYKSIEKSLIEKRDEKNSELEVWKSKVESLKVEAIESKNQATKNQEELAKELTRKQKDMSDLLAVLKIREQEVDELKKINKGLQLNNEDDLMKRFNEVSSPSKTKASVTTSDEYIMLKNELEEALLKTEKLELEIEDLHKSNLTVRQVLKEQSQKEDKNVQTEVEGMVRNEPRKLEELLLKSSGSRGEEKTSEEEESSRIYFQNLIIRYMVYEAKQNETECDIIRRAILDYLRIGTAERAMIDDAIKNRGGIKDSLYFFKMFGSN